MSKRNDVKLTELLEKKGFSLARKWDPAEKYGCGCKHKPSQWHLSRAIGHMVEFYELMMKYGTQAQRTRYVKYCKVLLACTSKCLDYEQAYKDLRISELYLVLWEE